MEVEKGPTNKVLLDSQPMTIDQPGKEKIKYEPPEKEEKETFDEKLFVFETQHSVGRDGEPAASKQHPILRRQSNVAKSSMKNLIVKSSSIKAVNSKPTLGSALCEICSKKFASQKILKVHMKHHGEKTDVCDVCSKAFTNKHILKTHVLTHTQEKIQCQICLESVFGLKNHMKYKHGEKNLVTCSHCGVEVKAISRHEKLCRMTEEERSAYKESKKVKCEQCDKVLANKFKLVGHIQAHCKAHLVNSVTKKGAMKTHI